MTVSTALVILSLTRGLAAEASEATPTTLTLQGEFGAQSPWTMDLSLHTERFFAQPSPRRATPPGPARTGGEASAVTPTPEPPPATNAAPAAAPTEACDVDCETAREGQRMARYVMRTRSRTLRTHRAFAIAAWSSMVVTEALGTLQAVNGDTWFGRGNCASDPRAFGCQQYSLIQSLHETFAFTTVGLYVTAGVLAIAAPDPENAAVGEGGPERRLRLHKAMAYVHGVGMILLPLLGILSIHPEIVGVTDDNARADFSRAMRSVHTIVGFTTFAALTFSAALEI